MIFSEHAIRQDPMIHRDDVSAPGFTTTPWSVAGTATLHAVGRDIRPSLELGLQAVLVLALAPASTPLSTERSAPIRGEGDDVGSLFADLVEDLLKEQIGTDRMLLVVDHWEELDTQS